MLTAVALGAGADIASLRQGFGAGAQTLPAAGQNAAFDEARFERLTRGESG